MRTMQKNPYTPIFTPRFHLPDATLTGMEVRIKRGQRLLSANDAFNLVQSGNGGNLLAQIAQHWSQWRQKEEKPLYLSWELPSKTHPDELKCFLDEWSRALPLQQLEIVLDADDLTVNEALSKAQQLFTHLPDKRIRRGLFHSQPCIFDADALCQRIDTLKLKRCAIMEMKDQVAVACLGHALIERLNQENIAIVADDLYSREDVTSAILMGIRYGQGYFLSRNQAPQKPVKTLKKRPGADVYERRIGGFPDLSWI